MVVWQDMPNGGLIDGDIVAVLSLMFGDFAGTIHTG